MTMQKVAWPRIMVRVENGISIMPKADRSDMPVMTPGRAIGRMISRLIWSRPKKFVRAIAAETSVPSTIASAVAMLATLTDSASASQISGRFQAAANHCVVRPGGGKA